MSNITDQLSTSAAPLERGWTESISVRGYYLVLAIITVFGAILRIAGLDGVPPTADGIGTVESAWHYMESGTFGATMWQHPKLRNILVYLSVKLLGGSAWGLNFWSLTFGILSLPMIAAVVRRLTGSVAAALLAALFLAVDSIHLDFSRQAIQETYMPFFCLLGIYCVLRFADQKRGWVLCAAGIAFGLGLAGKWYVLFPMAASAVFLIVQLRHVSREQLFAEGLLVLTSLSMLPAAVYMLTFLPWIIHGGNSLADLMEVHRLMASENLVHEGFSSYLMENDSWAYLWFIKPVAFADFMMQGTSPIVLLAISNPLVWMVTLPALVLVCRQGWIRRDVSLLFMAALFLCSYLPLIALRRPIWVNSSLAVLPFALMLVAYASVELAGRFNRGKLCLAAYLGLVILTSVPLYLLAVGKGYHNSLLHPIVELYRPANERQEMFRP